MKKISLIDIGSNTIRLVLFEYTEKHGIKEIRNIKTPARLAQYIDADGYMAEEGVSALLKILHSFKQISEKYHITIFILWRLLLLDSLKTVKIF